MEGLIHVDVVVKNTVYWSHEMDADATVEDVRRKFSKSVAPKGVQTFKYALHTLPTTQLRHLLYPMQQRVLVFFAALEKEKPAPAAVGVVVTMFREDMVLEYDKYDAETTTFSDIFNKVAVKLGHRNFWIYHHHFDHNGITRTRVCDTERDGATPLRAFKITDEGVGSYIDFDVVHSDPEMRKFISQVHWSIMRTPQ